MSGGVATVGGIGCETALGGAGVSGWQALLHSSAISATTHSAWLRARIPV
jgi:hypothetical protein